MLQGLVYLNAQCVYNKFQNMLPEHVGLRILLQILPATGAYAPGAAGPGAAAPGA